MVPTVFGGGSGTLAESSVVGRGGDCREWLWWLLLLLSTRWLVLLGGWDPSCPPAIS